MHSMFRSPRALWARFIKQIAQFSAGGSWTDLVPSQTRKNLRWFWFDGLFSSASESIIVTYQSLFILALGATDAQIGLLSSISSLVAVLMLLPGALLTERLGKRKEIALVSGGIIGRAMIFLIILIPIFLSGPAAVYAAITLTVSRDAMNNLGMPAWISLTADLVPLSWRGRYFGSRNFIMGIAGMIVTLVIGELLTRSGQLQSYQFAYTLALGLGIISTISFSRIKEPTPTHAVEQSSPFSFRAIPSYFIANPVFLAYCVTSAIWNFSLNISGPFFTVYQVKVLGATAIMVGILSITSQVSSLLAQRPFGNMADRWGPRKLVVITGYLIPFLPFVWIFIQEAWQGIPVNLLGGALWAGYSLASFNYLLTLIPEDQRARYSALYQIVVAISLSAGAAIGSVIVTKWGYHAVFLLSGIGRMLGAILFARFVHPSEVKSVANGTS